MGRGVAAWVWGYMADSINDRKIQHINIIGGDPEVDRRKGYFDALRLTHRALPNLNLKDVDTGTTFMGKKLSCPLLISCMTGGDHELARKINTNLALAAEATGVAMGVGSQRIMFSNPGARASFELRKFAPNTLLLANLGAVQLNHGFTTDMCKEAAQVLEADALVLHLNPLQEAVQPEGDTDFRGLLDKIYTVQRQLMKPVVVKEVGSGISAADVQELVTRGIQYIDVAGSGGTSWSRIEHHRQADEDAGDLGLVFQDWGIPTPLAIHALKPFRKKIQIIGSGGIRTGIDMAKAMILGASLCGLAAPFLKPAMESPERVVAVIEGLKREFRTAMFLLGMGAVNQLFGNENLIIPPGLDIN